MALPAKATKRIVITDARYEEDGLTALAAFWIPHSGEAPWSGRPLAARIVRCSGAHEAELRALLLGIEYACVGKAKRCEFWTDAESVGYVVGRGRDDVAFLPLVREVRNAFALRSGMWTLEVRNRSDITPAHSLAAIAMKCWKAGRREAEHPSA